MRKKSNPFPLILVLGLILGVLHPRLLGLAAEPYLNKALTRLFDMPVSIEGLRISPFLSRVSFKKFEVLNPPGFQRRDHFTARDVSVLLDLSVLQNKFIRIRSAHFKEAVFAIESYMTSEGVPRTNVLLWYHHMGLDAEGPPLPPRSMPHPDNIGEKNWRVRINRLELDKGTFIFDERCEPLAHKWIFEHIKGHWDGFDFLSDYASPTFTETIQVDATFGVNPPAHFTGGGKCQFADGDNFDVEAKIEGGSLAEYDFLLSEILGEVQTGTFDLKSHLLCVEGDLRSEHLLTLKSMTFAAPTTTQKILKYPFDAIRLLLEDQKSLELEIKVDGDIEDPKFRVFSAFTKAFQKALIAKTKAGIVGTVKIATSAPIQVTQGLTKLGSILVQPFTPHDKTDPEANGEKKNV